MASLLCLPSSHTATRSSPWSLCGQEPRHRPRSTGSGPGRAVSEDIAPLRATLLERTLPSGGRDRSSCAAQFQAPKTVRDGTRLSRHGEDRGGQSQLRPQMAQENQLRLGGADRSFPSSSSGVQWRTQCPPWVSCHTCQLTGMGIRVRDTQLRALLAQGPGAPS